MTAYDPAFETLCDGPLRGVLEGAETARRRALGVAALILVVGLGVVIALGVVLSGDLAYWAVVLGLLAVAALAWTPLSMAAAALKHPVLEAAAARHGFAYAPERFEPDAYERLHLLTGRPSGREFSDRFSGEHDGRPATLYEARLSTGSGRTRRQVFSGVVHVLRRRTAVRGEILVVPDRGLFNMFKPASDLQRVRYDDAAFEKAFEVYARDELEARTLIDADLRRRLLEWRGAKGRLFLSLHGDEAVLAISDNRNRFEPGSLLLGTPPRSRARRMADDTAAAVARLRDIAGTLG